ncbi:hypothetical protein PoB_004969500 [Plakobranchus ocellatus]|uniref:Uncharacterized protein n=1 Tax=Plakobranchus ocellatus TaxID=259542 RepID=A0AAV4BVP7_9GAST|nr:hypothetical protein PoB_004969500 [Plakobranchus ocellatus]
MSSGHETSPSSAKLHGLVQRLMQKNPNRGNFTRSERRQKEKVLQHYLKAATYLNPRVSACQHICRSPPSTLYPTDPSTLTSDCRYGLETSNDGNNAL